MTINEIRNKLKETGYIPTDDICYAVFGMLALNKPLLVEGAPGVGKLPWQRHWQRLWGFRC